MRGLNIPDDSNSLNNLLDNCQQATLFENQPDPSSALPKMYTNELENDLLDTTKQGISSLKKVTEPKTLKKNIKNYTESFGVNQSNTVSSLEQTDYKKNISSDKKSNGFS